RAGRGRAVRPLLVGAGARPADRESTSSIPWRELRSRGARLDARRASPLADDRQVEPAVGQRVVGRRLSHADAQRRGVDGLHGGEALLRAVVDARGVGGERLGAVAAVADGDRGADDAAGRELERVALGEVVGADARLVALAGPALAGAAAVDGAAAVVGLVGLPGAVRRVVGDELGLARVGLRLVAGRVAGAAFDRPPLARGKRARGDA